MTENRFICLGTSSGVAQADRATSGYALILDGSVSIIDCGGGVTSSFLRQGLKPEQVTKIIISHTHPDHVCELPLMIQAIYLSGRTEPISIYVPEEFVTPLTEYLPALYLFKEKMPFELQIVGYAEGELFDESFKLTAIRNNHLAGYKELLDKSDYPNKMQSYSFSLQTTGKSLFYSADIGSLADIKTYLNGHDYALIESTHVDLDELFEFIPTIKVGQFVITHLGEAEEIDDICRRADKAGIENLICAVDGLVLPL